MRTAYRTDFDVQEPEYPGTMSDDFPVDNDWAIVDVDWSELGHVWITWLVPSA